MQYNHEAVTALLIRSGANVEAAIDKGGWFPLYHAVDRSWSNIVRQLVAKGADVNRQDVDGKTALIYGCIYSSSTDCARSLLKCSAQLDIQDDWGRTALMCAAQSCYDEMVIILLESGADWKVRDNE